VLKLIKTAPKAGPKTKPEEYNTPAANSEWQRRYNQFPILDFESFLFRLAFSK